MHRKEIKRENVGTIGWDVFLFFALYVISPSYFALELSEKLPLLTLSRFLLVLIGCMLIFRRRSEFFNGRLLNWRNLNLTLTSMKPLRIGLFGYFLLLLISDIALLPQDFAEAVKAIFVVVVEEFMLVWMLTLILDTRKKILSALQTLVYASGIVGVVVAIGCVLECNPFFMLNTVQRDMKLDTEFRLGMVRAIAGFGHPVYYGAFCAVILPINMFFIEQSKRNWEKVLFSGSMAMTIVGLILANARGAIFAMGCLVIYCVIQSIVQRKFKHFCCTYIPVAVASIVVVALVSMLAPVGLKFLWGYVYSIIRIVLPDHILDMFANIGSTIDTLVANVTGGIDSAMNTPVANVSGADVVATTGLEYGRNASGGESRVKQLSGISYTLQRKPLFGFGSNAHVKNLIKYQFMPGEWWAVPTIDVGIVAVICQFGIVGFVGYTLLYGGILYSALKFREDHLMKALCVSFVTFLICLVTISSLGKMEWVLIATIVCLVNLIRGESINDTKNKKV